MLFKFSIQGPTCVKYKFCSEIQWMANNCFLIKLRRKGKEGEGEGEEESHVTAGWGLGPFRDVGRNLVTPCPQFSSTMCTVVGTELERQITLFFKIVPGVG